MFFEASRPTRRTCRRRRVKVKTKRYRSRRVDRFSDRRIKLLRSSSVLKLWLWLCLCYRILSLRCVRSVRLRSARLPLSFSANDERRYQQANARLVSEEASVKERSARSQRNHRCCHCQSLFSLFHSVSFTQCLSAQSLCPPIGLSLCFAHRAIIEYHICDI